jgi:hypothetical protein
MIEALNNELNSTWQLLKKKNKSPESIQVASLHPGHRAMHHEHKNQNGQTR